MSYLKVLRIVVAVCAPVVVAGAFVLFRPDWIVAMLARRSPDVVYFAHTEQPVVALTIDDGPDPIATPKILDVLKQHEARATFFLITSRIPGNEGIVARIVAEDHELANHLTADESSIRLSPSDFERQLLEAHGALSRFAHVRWFRPGSGWYNAAMLSILHRRGYRCVLGSVYPFDPHLPSSSFATRYVLRHVRPGSIIILHDYQARGERTAAALAKILPELNHRGFRVVTLSDLLDPQ